MLIVRKNQLHTQTYCVEQYDKTGAFVGVVSGLGRNRGTWDSEHSKRTAQRYAALLRKEKPGYRFTVSTSN